jgi:hypothetical protein
MKKFTFSICLLAVLFGPLLTVFLYCLKAQSATEILGLPFGGSCGIGVIDTLKRKGDGSGKLISLSTDWGLTTTHCIEPQHLEILIRRGDIQFLATENHILDCQWGIEAPIRVYIPALKALNYKVTLINPNASPLFETTSWLRDISSLIARSPMSRYQLNIFQTDFIQRGDSGGPWLKPGVVRDKETGLLWNITEAVAITYAGDELGPTRWVWVLGPDDTSAESYAVFPTNNGTAMIKHIPTKVCQKLRQTY